MAGLADLTSKVEASLARAESGDAAPPAPAAPASEAAPAAPAAPAGHDVSRATERPAEKPAVSSIVAPTPGATAAAASDLKDLGKLISDKGAKAILDALPEDTRIELGRQLYPRLHKTLSNRVDLSKADGAVIMQALERTGRSLEEFRDEVMTAGLDDSGKAAYRAAKEARMRAQAERTPTAGELTEAQVAVRDERYATVWREIVAAGLPADRADADVRAIWTDLMVEDSPLYHETDFSRVLEHVRTKSADLASKRSKKPGDAPAGSAPAGYISRSDAERLVADGVREALITAGVLTADTGRPGGAAEGTPAKPKTMDEARLSSLRRLEEAARI